MAYYRQQNIQPFANVSILEDRLRLKTSYDPSFVSKIKQLPAFDVVWNAPLKVWDVDLAHSAKVKEILWNVYKKDINIPKMKSVYPKEIHNGFACWYIAKPKENKGIPEIGSWIYAQDKPDLARWTNSQWGLFIPESVFEAYLKKTGGYTSTPAASPIGNLEAMSYYEILQVSRGAGYDQIRTAYRRQAKAWHPDVAPADEPLAAEIFMKVQEAWENLSDEPKRKKYDALLDWAEHLMAPQSKSENYRYSSVSVILPRRIGFLSITANQFVRGYKAIAIHSWEDIINNRGEIALSHFDKDTEKVVVDWSIF